MITYGLPDWELTVCLLAALILGAAVGIERQWRQRIAGLRTNALVSLGAASFVILPTLVEGEISPTRVAAQVVSGIGFLGAGVIMRDGLSVRGLNTAATLWCSAGIGVLAGSGLLGMAAVASVLVILGNLTLRPLARIVDRQPGGTEEEFTSRLRVTCRENDEAQVRTQLLAALVEQRIRLRSLHSHHLSDCVEVIAETRGTSADQESLEKAVSRLSLAPGVSAVSWSMEAESPGNPLLDGLDPSKSILPSSSESGEKV